LQRDWMIEIKPVRKGLRAQVVLEQCGGVSDLVSSLNRLFGVSKTI
jgi:hypothetical protein